VKIIAVLDEVTSDTPNEVDVQVGAAAVRVNAEAVLVEEAGRVNVVCTEYVTILAGAGLAGEDDGAAALCEDVGAAALCEDVGAEGV
jgi:hypothetical protein